jgi:CBS domain containing-hemolysin-like protein
LVTMEDLFETMIGMEIVDESDSHIDMQERARELWRHRSGTALTGESPTEQ